MKEWILKTKNYGDVTVDPQTAIILAVTATGILLQIAKPDLVIKLTLFLMPDEDEKEESDRSDHEEYCMTVMYGDECGASEIVELPTNKYKEFRKLYNAKAEKYSDLTDRVEFDGSAFIMPKLPGITLTQLVAEYNDKEKVPALLCIKILEGLIAEVVKMHRLKIISGDLKPDNIVVNGYNGCSSEVKVRVIDYGDGGLAKDNSKIPSLAQISTHLLKNENAAFFPQVPSEYWSDSGDNVYLSSASDIYSLAYIVKYLCKHGQLFSAIEVNAKELLDQLIFDMTSEDPSARPDAKTTQIRLDEIFNREEIPFAATVVCGREVIPESPTILSGCLASFWNKASGFVSSRLKTPQAQKTLTIN